LVNIYCENTVSLWKFIAN